MSHPSPNKRQTRPKPGLLSWFRCLHQVQLPTAGISAAASLRRGHLVHWSFLFFSALFQALFQAETRESVEASSCFSYRFAFAESDHPRCGDDHPIQALSSLFPPYWTVDERRFTSSQRRSSLSVDLHGILTHPAQ